ncbi:response regulator [Schumannella luteola]
MIRTLIVDDEPLVGRAHAAYLARVPGFELVGIAQNATQALSAIASLRGTDGPVELVLLDLTLPDTHGLELLRQVRAARVPVDVIAITAVRDHDSVRDALSLGAIQYLIKPFAFAAFREKLEHYSRYRSEREARSGAATQTDVDELIGALRFGGSSTLPKGLSAETLSRVSEHVRRSPAQSASEVADALALSRVTARRYLEHLADVGLVVRTSRYGTPGRPELSYSWSG